MQEGRTGEQRTRPADPLGPLWSALERGEARVAGCLSGTSADGIDVALTVPAPPGSGRPPELLAFETLPFPVELGGRLRALLDRPGARHSLEDLALLDRDLGRAFGAAAAELAAAEGVRLDLVGSHGQTVWHHDGAAPERRATLQLGDGASVAAAAGATAVTDFRSMDLALGGEGAPLSALADGEVFAALERPAAVLNLGGMANLTWLDEGDPAHHALAFDTGPAGSLLDGLARRLLDRPFDEGGAVAAAGRADAGLVEELAAHPFLARRPPKSTGRDTFGEPWVDGVVERARVRGVERPADLLASAACFVARSVAEAMRNFLPDGGGRSPLVLAGGGVRNAALVRELARLVPGPVRSAEAVGVDPDAREALVFAVLAGRCVLGRPSTRPEATGARIGGILGAIHPIRVEFPPGSEESVAGSTPSG